MDADELEDKLMEAMETGEILTIVYQGGSHPGAPRQIQPRSIFDDKIRALDVQSGRNKQYLIQKIRIVDGDAPIPDYTPTIYEKNPSVEELIEYHVAEAEKLGWTVTVTGNNVELFARFKNGNLRKTPSVSIFYEEYQVDYIITEDDWEAEPEEVLVKSPRPWRVASRAFKDPVKAFKVFMIEAREKAPD